MRTLRWLAIVCIAGTLTWLVHLCSRPRGPEGFEREAAAQVAAAVQAYRERHGRYPQRVEELVPGELPAMPTIRHWLVYAAESDGSQCWILDQVIWDSVSEYDCAGRRWQGLDISRSRAWVHPNKQVLEGKP
jgi:hypothetical protein